MIAAATSFGSFFGGPFFDGQFIGGMRDACR